MANQEISFFCTFLSIFNQNGQPKWVIWSETITLYFLLKLLNPKGPVCTGPKFETRRLYSTTAVQKSFSRSFFFFLKSEPLIAGIDGRRFTLQPCKCRGAMCTIGSSEPRRPCRCYHSFGASLYEPQIRNITRAIISFGASLCGTFAPALNGRPLIGGGIGFAGLVEMCVSWPGHLR